MVIRLVILIFVASLSGGLLGCVSSTKQADDLLTSPPAGLPRAHQIDKVPFIEQADGHCGPATLTMAMNWNGHPVTVDEIAPLVFTPGLKGTFQTDMVSASRRQGLFAVPIEGLASLFREIAKNHPVIVFENLALSWIPQWHYAIVFGYDLHSKTVLMHSGPEKNKVWDIRKLERSWKLADYWGLVVLKPGEIVESADELAHVTAAAGLEQAGHQQAAIKSYTAILKKWPTSLASLIALANDEYNHKNFEGSVKYLRIAIKEHPGSASAWHNLAFAEKGAKMKQDAKASAKRAIELATEENRRQYENSLREFLN